MNEVFISYDTADKERIRPLVEILIQQGWSLWWDPVIPPGQIFDEVIESALESAQCVVVIWSRESITSRWVKTEAHEGLQRGILVPVLLDDVKIPLEFRRIQAAQLTNWEGNRSHPDMIRLVDSIRATLVGAGSGQRPKIIPSSEASLPLDQVSVTTESEVRSGVLVILVGGKICLYAASNALGDWSLRPATIVELKRTILGDENLDSIIIRERGIVGTKLRVDFNELNRTTNFKYRDPEDLDSAQLDPQLWKDLATMIYRSAGNYEGIVVLHALDTIAYTASALSFMLRDLDIPVIVTGSQLPLNYSRTDAVQNLVVSITLAGFRSVGLKPFGSEVAVFSYDALLRANRSTLINSSSYRFLDSPTYPPLAIAGERLDIKSLFQGDMGVKGLVHLRDKVDAQVILMDVFPGIGSDIIENLNQSKLVRGVLLRTYGSGSAPMSEGFLSALSSLVASGVVVLNVRESQSGTSPVNEDPVSLRLSEQGVISAHMTVEAAYAKLVIELSNSTEPPEVIADLLQIDQAGELTQSVYHIHYGSGQTINEDTVSRATLSPRRSVLRPQLKLERVSYVQLFMLGVAPIGTTSANRAIDIALAIVDKDQVTDETVEELQQDTLRWFRAGRNTINVVYEITRAKGTILDPRMLLRVESLEPLRWSQLFVAIHCEVNT